MPDWFRELGWIALTMIVVMSVICAVVVTAAVIAVVFREWQRERKISRKE